MTPNFGQSRSHGIDYLRMPIAPSGAYVINDPSPSHSVLGCSGHSRPVGPLLFQLCFSVSPPTVPRPASLSLLLRVPGQGLACGAGCWLPEGVSDPAPLPPQYLLGRWFLSRSLPQIFISDLLPLDFVDAPQTGVEECPARGIDYLLRKLDPAPSIQTSSLYRVVQRTRRAAPHHDDSLLLISFTVSSMTCRTTLQCAQQIFFFFFFL